jgi:hypothetical protein
MGEVAEDKLLWQWLAGVLGRWAAGDNAKKDLRAPSFLKGLSVISRHFL